jgi:pimeloyl-ACP methyl ester carboxylesterase
MVYRSSRIKLSAGDIFWREAGDSHCPVLIFLHGSWHDGTQWQEIVEPLSKYFHCFALDLLGFGNSTAVETPSSIEIEVDCLHEFLTTLKLTSVYLVGHSLGGWIAIDYTLKYPDRVRGVVAISPEGFFLPNLHKYGGITKWLLSHPSVFKLSLTGLRTLASVSDGAAPFDKKQSYLNFFNQFPTTCKIFFQRSQREISSELASTKIAHFRKPISILQSASAEIGSIKQSEAYAKSIRTCEYRVIPEHESITDRQSIDFVVTEIKMFADRVQLKIDREEVELW